jgi:hypothetical protein
MKADTETNTHITHSQRDRKKERKIKQEGKRETDKERERVFEKE